MKKLRLILIVFLSICVCTLFSSDFDSVTVETADSLFAEEEFRRGVHSYNRGAYNDAILLFEKALSYLPTENLILDWLGRAYYRAGMEDAALQHWQIASNAGYGGMLHANRIEVVRERRVSENPSPATTQFAEAGTFPGIVNENLIFSQPSAILANDNGTTWVLAYGSNELLLIDVNGFIINRVRGPLQGFDRPMDILRMKDGTLLVTEYAGDRIAVLDSNGVYKRSIGSKGVGLGQFVGPQYMALDSSENLYVTDFGNARVSVFDKDGNPLFNFGKKNGAFPGFSAPTGICIFSDIVYVADAVRGTIYSFDRSGNYTGMLVPEKTFGRPEALRLSGDYILTSDGNRICSVDIDTGAVFENGRTGSAPSRILCATPDVNGNILASDFVSNEIYVMSKMTELVGGLFVQIERVNSDEFPNVTLELKVENRQRQPVVGLKAENFYLTENGIPVMSQKLEGSAYSNQVCDIVVVLDRSMQTSQHNEALESALKEIADSMEGTGTLTVISSGSVPTIEYAGAPDNLGDFTVAALKTPVTDDCTTDLAFRLAGNTLVNGEKKRAIIYLTGASSLTHSGFQTYGLSEMVSYFNNNAIAFYTVNLTQNVLPEEIVYITEATDGESQYVYRPEGLSGIVKDVIATPNGSYQLSYTSNLNTNFGKDYLPLEVEAYLLNRSGRDEIGYYAPLE
ncbi:MAG: hypothetical protein J6K76_07155 [Spirochaetaceae bacterium]|nr:hypothetical protein [Spirochaetaceae bacterium]